jgi:putative transcriptional regulator
MLTEISAGDLIIAPPRIPDSRFDQSVIMITHHEDISLGFCINKPLGIDLADVVQNMNMLIEINPEVYWGGPVNPQTIWIIHDRTWRHPQSLDIDRHWQIVSHQNMFKHLALDRQPKHYRIVMGCASWAPGQLESELRGNTPWHPDHSWLTLRDPDPDLIKQSAPEELWRRATDHCLRQAVDSVMS